MVGLYRGCVVSGIILHVSKLHHLGLSQCTIYCPAYTYTYWRVPQLALWHAAQHGVDYYLPSLGIGVHDCSLWAACLCLSYILNMSYTA